MRLATPFWSLVSCGIVFRRGRENCPICSRQFGDWNFMGKDRGTLPDHLAESLGRCVVISL